MELRSFLAALIAHPVSAVILVVTILTSIMAFRNRAMMDAMMLNPHAIMQGRRTWTLFTHALVHADWMHLAFNILAFGSIGLTIEGLAGPWRLAAIYVGSLLLGVLPTTVRHAGNAGYRSLGASAAVSGVLFSGLVYIPDARISLMVLPLPLPYPVFAVLFIAVSWYGARRNLGPIGHEAHLWGALSGLGIALLGRML